MYYILEIIYIFTIISEIICVFILLSKGERNIKTYLFAGCLMASMLWGISQMGIFIAANKLQLYISYIVGNIGVCSIGTFWVNFILEYTGKENKKFLYFSFGVSAFFYLVMITNPLHNLYYRILEMDMKEHALFFRINKYYIYLCVIMGIIMLLKYKVKTKQDIFGKYLMVAFVSIPFTLNLLQHFELVKMEAELTPLSFCITCIFIFVAMFKYDFLNINSLSFEEMIQDINDGVIIFSSMGKISYMNHVAKQYLGQIDDFETLCNSFKEVNLAKLENKEEVTVIKDDKFIQIQKIIAYNRKAKIVSVSFLFKDVSKYFQIIEQNAQISQLEQELLIEHERNNIIQMVHDTLGHTLTMIKSLIKLGIYSIEEPKEAEMYLVQAKGLASDGIRELREYITNTKNNSTNELVHCSITNLVETIKEIPIELNFVGQDSKKYIHLKEIIYLCIKEMITNCLKYACATKMQIIVKFLECSVELYIFDDGMGCDNIVYGNGMLGIKERVSKAGGEFRVNSAKNEGFQTFILLPI